jgi:hypothetical protein
METGTRPILNWSFSPGQRGRHTPFVLKPSKRKCKCRRPNSRWQPIRIPPQSSRSAAFGNSLFVPSVRSMTSRIPSNPSSHSSSHPFSRPARSATRLPARPLSRSTHPFQSTGKFYKPLLHKEQCKSVHSYLALKYLPSSFGERLIALRDMDISPFVKNETKSVKTLRLAWEARYPRPTPTFFQKRGADTRADYGIETKLRIAFRTLLVRWRQWRYAAIADPVAQMDPVTLEPIRKPVYLFDHRAKRTFVFEATTLHRSIRSALTFQLYMVSDPKAPKNLFTNTPFSYGQLTSLFNQLQAHGLMTFELMAWRKMAFCISRYRMYMDTWLQVDAHRQEIYSVNSEDGQEMILDFVIECLQDCNLIVSANTERLLYDAIRWFPEHDMIRRLQGLCMKQVEGDQFETQVRPGILAVFRQIYRQRSDLWFKVREKRAAQSREDADADEEGAASD